MKGQGQEFRLTCYPKVPKKSYIIVFCEKPFFKSRWIPWSSEMMTRYENNKGNLRAWQLLLGTAVKTASCYKNCFMSRTRDGVLCQLRVAQDSQVLA